MSIFFYKGEEYDLSKAEEREQFASFNSFTQQTASLAENWIEGENEFRFKTSGSTGVSQEIVHTRDKIQKSAELTIGYFNLTEKDKSLLILDPQRIAGAMMILRSLIAGMDLIVVDPTSDLTPYLPLIKESNFTAIVPMQLEMILKSEETLMAFRNYKAVLVGGAAVNFPMREKLTGKDLPFYETFGMTETVTHFAVRKLTAISQENPFESIGNHVVRQDSHGCMIVQGILTGNRPLPTHDLIRLIDEKHFEWIGRSDFVINSGGIKISPEELERKIADKIYAFGIRNRFVISSTPDVRLGEKLVLVFEGSEISDHIISEFLKTIKEDLDKHECPKEVQYLEKFPEVGNSKINRREIISLLA